MPSFVFDADRISLWKWCRYKRGQVSTNRAIVSQSNPLDGDRHRTSSCDARDRETNLKREDSLPPATGAMKLKQSMGVKAVAPRLTVPVLLAERPR